MSQSLSFLLRSSAAQKNFLIDFILSQNPKLFLAFFTIYVRISGWEEYQFMFTIREGLAAIDFSKVTAMLAATHWSPGITEEEVRKGAENSALVTGAFREDGTQIGYARVVSDKTRFAYLMDVIVEESCRASGIGEQMISYLLNHPELKDVYQWMLVTTYAHDFYEKCGFTRTARANDLMEIRKPRPR
jgi:ribosomal protein S18 acetylase RimI-like enzyme